MIKEKRIVGFTYDMRENYLAQGYSYDQTGEMDPRTTIDAIAAALEANNLIVDRIGNIKSLVQRLADGHSWDFVFNIAEGVRGIAREAQIPALLEAYEIPFVFSPADVMVTTLDKSLVKRILRDKGLATADFAIVGKEEDADDVTLPFPLFVKPIAEGSSKGICSRSIVKNHKMLRQICQKTIHTYAQPALVETYLPGREFTVGIWCAATGPSLIGTTEIISRHEEKIWIKPIFGKTCEQTVDFIPAHDEDTRQAEKLAIACAAALPYRGVVRIDIRLDGHGKPYFLEANPLPNLAPGSSLPTLAAANGIDYNTLIGTIIANSLSFYPKEKTPSEHKGKVLCPTSS